jgi:hypothetical protein
MQARFKGQGLTPPPPEALARMLLEVDGGLAPTKEGMTPTRWPRALFAAAIAEIGIRRMQEGADSATLFDGVDRDNVLEDIISRDRRTRWQTPSGAVSPSPAILEAHENLLALATFCRGFDLSWLKYINAALVDYLPAHAPAAPVPLDRALLNRMTRIDGDNGLAPLEPDILGERHLLDRLDILSQAGVHTALLDTGYRLSGIQAAYTSILTHRDHASRFAALDYFYPGDVCSLEAARIFAAAATDHIGKLGAPASRSEIEKLFAHIDHIRQDSRFADDSEIAHEEAKAAVNVTSKAGEQGHWDRVSDALARIDHIRQDSRFADDREIALTEAKAAVNVTSGAGEQGLWDRVSAALARIDHIRQDSRFADDREIALQEAKAAVNVTSDAGEQGLWDRVSDALARIDHIRQDSRFADDGEILLQESKAGLAIYHALRKGDAPSDEGQIPDILKRALSVIQAQQYGVSEAEGLVGYVFAAIKDAAGRWPENAEIAAIKAQFSDTGLNWDDVPDWPEA